MPDRTVPREGWRRYLPRSAHQVGRRGAILLTLGFMWVVIGLGVYDSAGVDRDLLHEYIPSQVRALLWIVTGLLAIVHSFRPPGMSDALGFAALYLTPAMRVVSYALAWVDSLVPGMGDGYPQAWRFLAIYSSMLAAVIITSGWPEPISAPRPGDDDNNEGDG